MSGIGKFMAMLVLLVALPGAALAAAATAPAPFGRYHAVVIGNNDYEHLDDLKTAVSDAAAVAEVLRIRYGYKVTLLLNASRSQILKAINRLRDELTEKDRLLIYYAGHGELDRETDTGYWLPVDAEPDDDTNWIPNERLTRHFRAMLARHVLVVDSCFSGTLVRSTEAAGGADRRRADWVDRLARARSRTALVSGGLEPVVDGGRGGHSVFANAFLSILRDNDQILDGQSLFQTLRRRVVLNADQTPRYSTIRYADHEGGDFLFVPLEVRTRPQSEPVATPAADDRTVELTFWSSVKDARDPTIIRTYLERYPDGIFAGLARARLAALERGHSQQQRRQTAAREAQAWDAVSARPTIEALTLFLQEFPDGANAGLARIRLAALNAAAGAEAEARAEQEADADPAPAEPPVTPTPAPAGTGIAVLTRPTAVGGDGRWLGGESGCDTMSAGWDVGYDVELSIGGGRYVLKVAAIGVDFNDPGMTREFTGDLPGDGRIRASYRWGQYNEHVAIDVQLKDDSAPAVKVNGCRVAMSAAAAG